VIRASFYFWESGTIIQRSREGLLRSLLTQLLKSQPGLIPQVFEELWGRLWVCSTLERVRVLAGWELETSTSALRRYFELKDRDRRKVFLVIDGLDELEGDPKPIIDLLFRIQVCGRVKICVSSRAWDVFNEAFQGIPSLRLQDLTAGDMERFIRGSLASDKRISSLMAVEPEGSTRLVELMFSKAGGVFLWVSLAVQAIEATEQITMDTLVARIEELPADLDGFYRYRLIETSPAKTTMAQIFQLLRARQEVAAFTRDDDTSVMTLWEMVLASAEYTTSEVCEIEIQQIDREDAFDDCRDTMDTIRLATARLIRVQPSREIPLPDRPLTYIHRTVKDWLAQPSVWTDILNHAPIIHPHLAHLRSVVLSFKFPLIKPRRARSGNTWWPQIVLALTHSRSITNSPPTQLEAYDLLIALNDTLTWYYHARLDPDLRKDSWSRNCFGSLEERGRTVFEEPFLALCIRFGLVDFVRRYLDSGRYDTPKKFGKSLLGWSTIYLVDRQSSIYPLSDPEIVEMLLEYGLDPNHRTVAEMGYDWKPKAVKTPWESTLEAVQQGQRRGWIKDEDEEGIKRWCRILKLFLEFGADPGVEVKATYKDRKERARELLERVSKVHDSGDLRDICELLEVELRER